MERMLCYATEVVGVIMKQVPRNALVTPKLGNGLLSALKQKTEKEESHFVRNLLCA